MNQARMGLLVAAALMAMPAFAHAQGAKPDKGKKPAAAGDAKSGKGDKPADKPADAAAAPDGAAAGSEKKEDKPADAPPPPADEGTSICDLDPSQCPRIDEDEMSKRPITAQMYAVQQKYALRVRRVEINPYWSLTLNDQFVSHPAPGIAANYFLSDVLAIGANFNWYKPFGGNLNQNSVFNTQARRAARIAVPLTEYDWSTALNFTYVPMYGKFAGFGDFIFHFDAYVVGGIGVLSDRPIAVIDPDNRSFKSKVNVSPNVGLGLRIFFNRWFAATLEVRDYIFFDKLESTTIATDPAKAQDESTWYDTKTTFTNNVQAQLGISIFLPFSWEYRLPK